MEDESAEQPAPPSSAGATTAGPTTSEDAPRPWQLRRSLSDRKLKGVAGGLAAAANVDSTLVRILVAVAMFSGWGIVVYIVLCFVMKDETRAHPAKALPHDQRLILRVVLGVAAVAAATRVMGGWPFGGRDGGVGFGFILVAIGAAVLWTRRDAHRRDLEAPVAYGDVAPSWEEPVGAPFGSGVDWRSTGRDLLRLVGAFIAVWAFIALVGGAVLVASGAVHMRLPLLPAAVGLVGFMALMNGVVRKGRAGGLVFAALALLLATGLAVGLTSFSIGAGEKPFVLAAGAEIPARFEHGAGHFNLDLRNASVPPGVTKHLDIRLGTGTLELTLPNNLGTSVHTKVGVGHVEILGSEQNGGGIEMNRDDGGAPSLGTLAIDIKVGAGRVIVSRASTPAPAPALATVGREITTESTTATTAKAGEVVLTCGPADTDGNRRCTRSAPSTSTTVPTTVICHEDLATKQTACPSP